MRIDLSRWVRADAPRSGNIRYWTHAAGAGVLLLIVPSLCAVYLHHIGVEENEAGWIDLAKKVWTVHLALVVVTPILWLIETPKLTKFVTTESDMVDHKKDE